MKAWLKRVSDQVSFTPTERTVVLTLVGALLLGLGVRFFRDGAGNAPPPDYSASDAEFAAKSARAPAPDSVAGDLGRSAGGSSAREIPATNPPKAKGVPSPVDLNGASKAELMTLPGVGPVLADRILEYRGAHGPFASVAGLLKVRGIGKKTLDKIAPFCFVEK